MPRLSHDDVRRFYDVEYYGAAAHDGSPSWHVRSVANRLGDLTGKTALDVACGEGQWLAELARRGAVVAGIDISARALERCRDRLPAADLREGVAEELPFADRQFDLVTCLGSLEHFIDQPKALSEMRRVARADANFLILVPNAGFLTRRLRLYGGTQQIAIKEDVKPLQAWEELFARVGLSVERRWRDLHVLSPEWIARGPWPGRALRLLQALVLPFWPVGWQYQVYFLCRSTAN
jgi:SAM-dependent methyltransferase